MSPPSVDPAAVRAGLERQLALLEPVVAHLRSAATDTGPLVAEDWRGPAAEAAAGFIAELRGRLAAAEEATDDVVRGIRLHLAALL